MRRTAFPFALLALAACGGATSTTVLPDAAPSLDARQMPDALPGCAVHFLVAPAAPVAPLTLSAMADVTGGVFGFISIDWHVMGPDGLALTVANQDSSGLSVTFPASTAGAYSVSAVVFRGGQSCFVFPKQINVAAPNASVLHIRLRYVPQPGQGAPPQVAGATFQVPRGVADYVLPAVDTLDPGTQVEGTVRGPAGGIAANLRLLLDGGETFDLFADALGRYAARVPAGVVKVRLAPYADVAARDVVGMLATSYQLDAGDAVTGTVRTAAGAPVSGARVAAATAALPPLVATTGADGRFATRIRAASGALTTLTIVAPEGAPMLTLPDPTSVGAGADLDVKLPDLAVAPFAGRAVDSSGAPLPGAEVTLVATGALANGSVSVDGAAALPLTTQARTTAIAGAGGMLPPLSLPTVAWQAIVDPGGAAGQTIGTATLDAGSAGKDLAAAAPTPTPVTIRDTGGQPIAFARLLAVSTGVRGVGAGRAVSVTAGVDGVATLPLAPGVAYTLIAESRPEFARARVTVVGGAAPPPVVLARAIRVHGSVVFASGGGQPGVGVEALCPTCPDPTTPIAEAITGPAGDFILYVPDPGTP